MPGCLWHAVVFTLSMPNMRQARLCIRQVCFHNNSLTLVVLLVEYVLLTDSEIAGVMLFEVVKIRVEAHVVKTAGLEPFKLIPCLALASLAFHSEPAVDQYSNICLMHGLGLVSRMAVDWALS